MTIHRAISVCCGMTAGLHVDGPHDIFTYKTCKLYSPGIQEAIDATNNWNH